MVSFGNRLRTPEFARRKRRVLYIKIALAVAVVALVIGGLSYLAHVKSLQIRDVVVVGAEVVDESELTALAHEYLAGTYLWLFPKSNILIYPKEALQAQVLDSFKRLKTAEISFDSLHGITLTVTERPPEALWCGENRLSQQGMAVCYFLDPEGYIYTEAPTFTGSVYVRFYGPLGMGEPVGQTFVPTEQFQALRNFLQTLTTRGIKVAELALTDTDVELYLENGTKILFLKNQELPRVLDNLLSVFSAPEFKDMGLVNLEYIDLRFGNKVYYKEQQL